jgi:hypothetical protein
VSPGGHQRGDGAVPGAIVFETHFCTDLGEIGWFNLPNWTVWLGCCWELATASALISIFFALGLVLLLCNLLWTFLHAMLCFIIGRSLTPRPCLILIPPDLRASSDPHIGCLCGCRGAFVVFERTGWSSLAFRTIQFAYLVCCWPTPA